jgi:hypothetical protein
MVVMVVVVILVVMVTVVLPLVVTSLPLLFEAMFMAEAVILPFPIPTLHIAILLSVIIASGEGDHTHGTEGE